MAAPIAIQPVAAAGSRIRAIRPGAVDAARAELKPEIPDGNHGIPLRDEIELERAI